MGRVECRVRVVGAITVEAPADMLREQLARGSTARLRAQAARAMKKQTTPTVPALGTTLTKSEALDGARRSGPRPRQNPRRGRLRAARGAGHDGTPEGTTRRRFGAGRVPRGEDSERSPRSPRRTGATSCRRRRRARSVRRAARGQRRRSSPRSAPRRGRTWCGTARSTASRPCARKTASRTCSSAPGTAIPSATRRAAVAAIARLSDTHNVREHVQNLLEDKDPHLRWPSCARSR